MRIPLSWLKDYVDIDAPAQELAEKLSGAGVPVEKVEYISPDVTGVYVGHVKETRRHPNADKLILCEVDLGEKFGSLQIVTGAPNVRQDHKVPVALHGARLAEGLKIKKSKIRGEESNGMMCSASELGIDIKDLPQEQREGVLILPQDSIPGESLIDLYCLHDPILEIETFANRPDQLSILGIAREAAAIFGKTVKYPATDFAEEEEKTGELLKVEIKDKNLCRKYSGRIITDMPGGPSPLWMQGRLFASGIRAVNRVVDITNYVMLETGQPLHAFDFDKVKESRIIVRSAVENETIVTLDGQERKLDPSVLVIADGKDPVAMAGVMGGLHSEITGDTKRILLESACFSGPSIRRTSIRMGLRSESSNRFEKGIDFHQVDFASRRASALLSSMGGKVLMGEAVDSVPPPEPAVIKLRPARVNQILGTDLDGETISGLLSKLEFKTEKKDGDFIVTAPTLRQDITSEIDLIEEVARLYGYDQIPLTLPRGNSEGMMEPRRAFFYKLRQLLVRSGLYECITPSLYEEKVPDLFGIDGGDLFRVKNPITEDQAVLRAEGIPHLVSVVKNARGERRGPCRVFEISNFYSRGPKGEPVERQEATVAVSGEKQDFFTLKGILEGIFRSLSIDANFEKAEYPSFHPGKTAIITASGREIGLLGALHPRIAHQLDVSQEIFCARLYLEPIREMAATVKYKPVPRFPGVRRDLALLSPVELESGKVREIIMETGAPLLEDAVCFDVYTGGQVSSDKKSLAFALSFISPERTLTEGEVQEKVDAILTALRDRLSVVLRS